MIWNWIKSFLKPSEEDKKFFDSLHKLYEEYDVRIGPRGGISKTSKPEYLEKHLRELSEVFPEIREEIRKNGFCKIKG